MALTPLESWHWDLEAFRRQFPNQPVSYVGRRADLEETLLKHLRELGIPLIPTRDEGSEINVRLTLLGCYRGAYIFQECEFDPADGYDEDIIGPAHFEIGVGGNPKLTQKPVKDDESTYQGMLSQLKEAREKAVQAAREESRKIASKIGFPPVLQIGSLVVKCDACAFPSLDKDLEALGWPIVDAGMWDVDTRLNVLVTGALPLGPGQSVVLQQEAERVLSWIPHTAQIVTKWLNGPPQPGLLTYYWSVSDAHGRVDVLFAIPLSGHQFEPTPAQARQVKFPTYKGADTIIVGRDARLRLHVTLDSAATSTLEEIKVFVAHKRAQDFAPTVEELPL